MKYPAIYKSEDGSTYLHASKLLFSHLVNGKAYEWRNLDGGDEQEKDTNITREYLSNTWGVVESKEHAEFIVELAGLHGFKVIKWGEKITHFNFRFVYGEISLNLLGFGFYKDDLKQITIPLPPKAKEWPQVGDEVVWGSEVCNGVVKAIDEHLAWIKTDQGSHVTEYIDKLKKPKSKQELLIEELQTKLCNNNAVDNYILACDIINGEIKGLSYEL